MSAPPADRDPWSATRPMMIGLMALAVLLGGFAWWGASARIAGAIIAAGHIAVERNRQVIQHPDSGVIDEILVREGDVVAAGQLLIRLDDEDLRSELTLFETELFEILARMARLRAERDGAASLSFDPLLIEQSPARVAALMQGQRQLFQAWRDSVASERERLATRRMQVANQIDGLIAQRSAIARQLALIEQELESRQSLLDRGLSQISAVLALQRAQADLNGRMGEISAAIAGAEGRITELEIERLGARRARREEAIRQLRDLEHREAELRERRRTVLRQIARTEIRAPVSGVVHGLNVFAPRAVIRPAEAIMHLIPRDRPLVILAEVEPINIDQVFIGQDVMLRFAAFDQRTSPELAGAVARVSADTFRDDRTGQDYYRVEIMLRDGQARRLPDGLALIPGMPVEAFIRTGERAPIAFLVKPLSDYFARAFREP